VQGDSSLRGPSLWFSAPNHRSEGNSNGSRSGSSGRPLLLVIENSTWVGLQLQSIVSPTWRDNPGPRPPPPALIAFDGAAAVLIRNSTFADLALPGGARLVYYVTRSPAGGLNISDCTFRHIAFQPGSTAPLGPHNQTAPSAAALEVSSAATAVLRTSFVHNTGIA
jgi:hypothetical protein